MDERLVFNYGTSRREVDRTSASAKVSPAAAPPVAASRTRERHDWAFVGLMGFTAVLFFRPQDTIPGLGALHLAELTAIVALVALIMGRLGRGLPPIRVTPEVIGVAALGGIMLATAPFSIWMGGAIETFTDLYVKVLLIFVLMISTLNSPKRIAQFSWLLVLATGYISFRAVFDYARGINLIENGRVQGAIGGMFKNPNDLALNLVSVLPLAAALALRPVGTVKRLTAVAAGLLTVMAIVASHSRAGFLGLALMIVVLGILMFKRRPGLVSAGALIIVLSTPLLPDSYVNRLASITDESQDETGSREARRTLMREAWATFLANPITGVGGGQFKNYNPDERDAAWRETHNALLQVAAELGITGLVVFSFLIVRAFLGPRQTRLLLRRVDRDTRGGRQPPLDPLEYESLQSHRVAIAAALAGWFLCSQFASVAYHWTFYYLLALAVSPREVLLDRIAGPRVAPSRIPAQALPAEVRA